MQADPAPQTKRVLVVDNDRAFADALLSALSDRGYAAAMAVPAHALTALGDFESEVVLCGVEGAGADLPALITNARPDLICVAMAARANLRRAANPFSDDALAFINKTQGLDAALAVVEKCFKKREASTGDTNGKKTTADEANHAKLEFLAREISHELRTPLNAIIGFSELIIRDARAKFGNDQHRTYIEDIHSSGRHLLDIINDILDFAKAEAGKLVLQESEVDIKEVAVTIKRLVGPRAREAGIELSETFPEKLPNLWCDERKLKQMLLNLLSNAVKFTPPEGRVELAAEESDGALVISVRDTGIGISEIDLSRVLQPFIQVDSTWTRKQEGTGLGLPLVKAMAELHGGSIALESEVAKGTTVRLIFPRERVLAPRMEEEFSVPRGRSQARGAK